jgi:CubicO group peptidase (beta-lactamase class C family)
MESGINARAVDYARFGLLYLHQGNWNGQQILPSDWVTESTSPDPLTSGLLKCSAVERSRRLLWVSLVGMNNADGSYDYMASGNLGQTIYISPVRTRSLCGWAAKGIQMFIGPTSFRPLCSSCRKPNDFAKILALAQCEIKSKECELWTTKPNPCWQSTISSR